MDSQSKNSNLHIKLEETDVHDSESTIYINGSIVDEQCSLCSSFDCSTHIIKVEVDYDDDESQGDLISQSSVDRLEVEYYHDGEDESLNEAISISEDESIGNRQSWYVKKVQHMSFMSKCQICSKAYSGGVNAKNKTEPFEYVCDNCSSIRESMVTSDSFSEVTHDTKTTDLDSELVLPTMVERHNALNTSKETKEVYISGQTLTAGIMASESRSKHMLVETHTNGQCDEENSCYVIESGKNNQNDDTRKKQYQVEIESRKRTHNGEKQFKSEICQSSQLGSLKTHMKTHNGEKPYKCELCPSMFSHLSSLQRHMRTHSGEKPYKCEICQYASTRSGNLKTHMRTHSGEKPFKCEICQFASYQLPNLKVHMRTHDGEKPYKCDMCDYASSVLCSLKRHMRTHSGEKPYKCEVCQYAFSQSDALTRHMRTHSGEKPYKCEICQTTFSRVGTLKSHVRTHSGEKPYKCQICQYAFRQSGSLRKHMRTHTGEKPYKCEICQYASRHLDALKRHKRTHSL